MRIVNIVVPPARPVLQLLGGRESGGQGHRWIVKASLGSAGPYGKKKKKKEKKLLETVSKMVQPIKEPAAKSEDLNLNSIPGTHIRK